MLKLSTYLTRKAGLILFRSGFSLSPGGPALKSSCCFKFNKLELGTVSESAVWSEG